MGSIVWAVSSRFPLIFGRNVTFFQVRKTGCANQLLRQENRTRILNGTLMVPPQRGLQQWPTRLAGSFFDTRG
jgi:hypothetical protein